jgi:hypothetical protein
LTGSVGAFFEYVEWFSGAGWGAWYHATDFRSDPALFGQETGALRAAHPDPQVKPIHIATTKKDASR